MVLIGLLGAVFLKGFREAVGLAVALVFVYLFLNLIVIVVSMGVIIHHPETIRLWKETLVISYSSPLSMLAIALLLFPKLALGLSGFETGVAVMPMVKGYSHDDEAFPQGRIRNTYKLLTTAALIMSFFLLISSIVTILLIPAHEFQPGGSANGRALAFLAHQYLGNTFGTLYDLSTISILWFAGASAMAGLVNIVPRYLPRYGMAPNWTRAVRPLVLVYTAIALVVTFLFQANVEAQGGACATGVLVLMSSAAFAVNLLIRRQAHASRQTKFGFALITLIFFYTTIANMIERPEGLKIAAFFISAIVITSLVSRIWRSTELRVERIEFDAIAQEFIQQEPQQPLRIIAHRRNRGTEHEYSLKEKEVREDNHLLKGEPILFLEVQVSDASDFTNKVWVEGVQLGSYRVLRAKGAAIPNTIAAILLYIRDTTGTNPHSYFGWVEGNPIQYLLRFVLFGEGDIAIVTREVLRKAERNPKNRPAVHVSG